MSIRSTLRRVRRPGAAERDPARLEARVDETANIVSYRHSRLANSIDLAVFMKLQTPDNSHLRPHMYPAEANPYRPTRRWSSRTVTNVRPPSAMEQTILIIWPDDQLAAALHDSLLRSGLRARPKVVRHYPNRAELEELTRPLGGTIHAVVVGLGGDPRAFDVIKQLKQFHPSVAAIAADAVESTESLRGAMRAGASEYLTPPFAPEDLKILFASRGESATSAKPGRLVCFLPCKATDGASTVATHVAQSISSEMGARALLVDCDIHCGTTAFRLGVSPEYTLADAIRRVDSLDELWDQLTVRWKGLDVLVAPEQGSAISTADLTTLPAVLQSAARCYEHVIADMPAAISETSSRVLGNCSTIYLVCTPVLTSLHLARRKVAELLALGLPLARVQLILNRVGSRNSISPAEVERAVGVPVAWSAANDYVAVTDATIRGGLVSRDSELGDQLFRLACNLAGHEEESRTERGWKRILSFG